jgi:coproporphyrinogen III oxidase-like Fe-S oxidoreductase
MGIPGSATTPIFGSDFKLMFRLNRPHFQRLVEDIMGENLQFYKRRKSSSITTVFFGGKTKTVVTEEDFSSFC